MKIKEESTTETIKTSNQKQDCDILVEALIENDHRSKRYVKSATISL